MNIFQITAVLLVASGVLFADTITFEQFNDGDQLTNQISGITFTNATVVTAGISLNELEFPPHSGVNAVFDDGGPVTIAFAAPVSSFSGFFTYTVPLTLQEFDSSGHLLVSVSSKFSSNLAISGDPGSSPNELLQALFVAPMAISKVTITGDPRGSSFVMDDVSFQSTAPEPSPLSLMICGAMCLTIGAPKLRRIFR